MSKNNIPIGKKKSPWWVKVETLEEFKQRCLDEGRSQAEVLEELLQKYLNN
jgi:hypothetical protein